MPGQAQRKLTHAARAEAARHFEANPLPHTDPAEALQWMVDRITAMLKYAAHQADDLPDAEREVMGAFGPIPHYWIRVENDLRQELSTLCVNVERIGLADRMIRIQESRATLINRAMVAALKEAGVKQAVIREVGPSFVRHLRLIQGGAEAA